MLLRCEEGQQHNPLNAVPVCECVCMCVFLCEWCVCVCVCMWLSRNVFALSTSTSVNKKRLLAFLVNFLFLLLLLRPAAQWATRTHAHTRILTALRLVQLMRDALRFLCTWRGATSSYCIVVSANIEQALQFFKNQVNSFNFSALRTLSARRTFQFRMCVGSETGFGFE